MAEKDLSNVPQVVSITNNNSGEIKKEVTLPGGKGNVEITEPYNDNFRFQFFKTNTWFDLKPGDTLKVLAQSSAELNNYLEQATDGVSVTVEDVEPEPPKKSDVATLKSLAFSGGTMDPAFDADTMTYSVTFPAETTTTDITAEPTDSKATVEGTGTGKTVTNGGSLEVVVTAEDGSTKKTYTASCVVPDA